MEWDDDVTQTATSQPAVVVKRDRLAWGLFVGTAVLFAVTTALLVHRAGGAQARATEAYVEKKRAEADVVDLTDKLAGQTKRAEDAETQVRAVSAERDALRAEVDSLRDKVALVEDAPPVVKPAPKKVVKKKATKKKKYSKKKRRR